MTTRARADAPSSRRARRSWKSELDLISRAARPAAVTKATAVVESAGTTATRRWPTSSGWRRGEGQKGAANGEARQGLRTAQARWLGAAPR